jgi:four helix bundle protein
VKRNHRDLRVWQFAMALVERIYALTAAFPRDEIYGLTSQMRRAAISIPSNIAEGAARGTTKELLHFLRIADSSLSELDTQLELAKRLRYIADTDETIESMNQLSQSLAALKSSLNRRVTKTTD